MSLPFFFQIELNGRCNEKTKAREHPTLYILYVTYVMQKRTCVQENSTVSPHPIQIDKGSRYSMSLLPTRFLIHSNDFCISFSFFHIVQEGAPSDQREKKKQGLVKK